MTSDFFRENHLRDISDDMDRQVFAGMTRLQVCSWGQFDVHFESDSQLVGLSMP